MPRWTGNPLVTPVAVRPDAEIAPEPLTVAAVPTSIHAEIDGTTWYFCCPGCRDSFVASHSTAVNA